MLLVPLKLKTRASHQESVSKTSVWDNREEEEFEGMNDGFYNGEEKRINDRLSMDLNNHLIKMNLKIS